MEKKKRTEIGYITDPSWEDKTRFFSKEEIGTLICAIWRKAFHEEPYDGEDLPPKLLSAFYIFMCDIDKCRDSYEETCRKKREAMERRWGKRKDSGDVPAKKGARKDEAVKSSKGEVAE